jgi:hypothetical protein
MHHLFCVFKAIKRENTALHEYCFAGAAISLNGCLPQIPRQD